MLIRVFTSARKVRRLVGKFGDGRKIPLGPYTYSQVAAAAIGFTLAVIAVKLISAWSFAVITPLTVIAVVALAFVPETQVPIHWRGLYELRYQLRRSPRIVGEVTTTNRSTAPHFIPAADVPILTPDQPAAEEHTSR